jgi:hypothetical protein
MVVLNLKCIFLHFNSSIIQEIHQISLEKNNIPIQSTILRTIICFKNIYKNFKVNNSYSE